MYLLLGILICGVLAVVVVGLLEYFSTERRALRSSRKDAAKLMSVRLNQLREARRALTKIAANDSGNPTLDAQLALETISSLELDELES